MKRIFGYSAALLLIATAQAPAHANECQLSIDANDLMQFSSPQLTVPASCTEVEVTLRHVGKQPASVMGHNWVLTRARDAAAIANLGMGTGMQKDYLPSGDARIIAATKLVGGGETASLKFSTANLKPEEEYTYFCSAPGHIAMMKGRLVLKK